jgi:hypothetical protein
MLSYDEPNDNGRNKFMHEIENVKKECSIGLCESAGERRELEQEEKNRHSFNCFFFHCQFPQLFLAFRFFFHVERSQMKWKIFPHT